MAAIQAPRSACTGQDAPSPVQGHWSRGRRCCNAYRRQRKIANWTCCYSKSGSKRCSSCSSFAPRVISRARRDEPTISITNRAAKRKSGHSVVSRPFPRMRTAERPCRRDEFQDSTPANRGRVSLLIAWSRGRYFLVCAALVTNSSWDSLAGHAVACSRAWPEDLAAAGHHEIAEVGNVGVAGSRRCGARRRCSRTAGSRTASATYAARSLLPSPITLCRIPPSALGCGLVISVYVFGCTSGALGIMLAVSSPAVRPVWDSGVRRSNCGIDCTAGGMSPVRSLSSFPPPGCHRPEEGRKPERFSAEYSGL